MGRREVARKLEPRFLSTQKKASNWHSDSQEKGKIYS